MATITVENVEKKYADHVALKGISFSVPEHVKCVGFLGPNGSGKTTSIRIMSGLLKPTSGKVDVAGINVLENPYGLRAKIGYVEQHPAFLNWMTGQEFLVFMGQLFKLSGVESKRRAKELLERVGLGEAANRRVGRYSGGMKKRLGIAQALMGNPDVVFMDEPVAEMDPIGRLEILDLIQELKSEVTVFMSTHILEDIERTADQIIILNHGVVRSISTLHELRAKYETVKLTVEVTDLRDEFLKAVEREAHALSIENVQAENGRLLLTPANREVFEVQFSDFLKRQPFRLRHYEWMRPSLEDIFMKVVNEE